MKKKSKTKAFFGDVKQHLMTGVSHILPLIIVYALFMVLGQIPGAFGQFCAELSGYAQMLIPTILAAYIAFSIAGKMALVPAFVVGVMSERMGMGFIGGIIVGLLSGYVVKLLVMLGGKLKAGQMRDIFMSFLIVPILTSLAMGALVYFVIANPIANMMVDVNVWLTNISSGNAVLLAVILGAMIAFDMGGPVNKLAFTFALGAFDEGLYHILAPVLVAITVPPLAMALATFLNKKKYTADEKRAGKTALFMGLVGLTEGAIPFAVVDPFRVIPSIIVGSSLGAALTALFGISNSVPIPSLVGMAGASNILLYLVCHIIPIVLTALLVNLLKKNVEEQEA